LSQAVLVIGERLEGGLASSTSEMMGGGRTIADQMNGPLEIALVGEGTGPVASEAIARGADRVYLLQGPKLSQYQPESWLKAITELIRGNAPELVLIGQTAMGRDLAPRLACRLGAGLAMDCTKVEWDPEAGMVRMSRPVFGGKAIAVEICSSKPAMATVRAKAMKTRDPDTSRQGEVAAISVEIDDSVMKSRTVARIREKAEGVPLQDARVVVSGGRGIGGPEGFDMLDALARVLGGATGASRPPCDAGWVPSSRQVGLTGKMVRPDLYLAVALSGSSQHMAGCQDSKTIIAINKDPEANIFSYAHYGVVGDYRKILPPLLTRLKEKMK
jgi:electron transfer flavoprotein alpha subunit